MAKVYTDDAVLLPPNSEAIRGRQGIAEFWRVAIEMGVKEVVLTTVSLLGSGNDIISELGKYVLTIQPSGQAPTKDRGKYVVVWKRTDQKWMYHWDIWNSDMPP